MKRLIKITVAAVLLAVSPLTAFAAVQGRAVAKGRVISSDGSALAYVTVALMSADSTVVAGTSTADDGSYRLESAPGHYRLAASMIGYVDRSVEVELAAEENEMEDIVMEEDAAMLDAARVTGKVNLVEMKMDKIVMNVSQSAFASTSNALDLVKKAPGVTVDKDGNIKLNGKSVDVWIDGRPSHMDGKSLEALLRSTAGSTIEKFELMPNPSSKYDASGQGGIINIKTKKTLASGFNGSMGASGGGMYFKKPGFVWMEDFWANLNYRGKKTNTFLNLYEGIYNNAIDYSSRLEMTTPAGEMSQSSDSFLKQRWSSMNIKLGNDWFISDRDILGFIVNVPGSLNDMGSDGGDGFNGSSLQEYDGMRMESNSKIDNGSKSLTSSVNLNYTHVFDEGKSSELTTNLDWYRTGQRTDNDIFTSTLQIRYTAEDAVQAQEQEVSRTVDNTSTVNIYSAKIDWQTMFWKNAMIEAGAKWAGSFTDNAMLKTETDRPDTGNDYSYSEHIAALYVSVAKPFGTKLTLKAGLRGEYTYSYGDWKSSATSTKRSYFDLFPTLYVGYTPSEKAMLSFSYTRRINRPGYYSLNPAESFVDEHSYMRGNPDLKPQYTNSVSLSSVIFQHYTFSLGYNYTGNMFNQIPSFRENGDMVMTWGNFGQNHIVYLSAGLSSLQLAKWFEWTMNLGAMYNCDKDGEMTRHSFSFSGYTDFTFNLPKDWKIELDGWYSSPTSWGYVRMGHMWMSNFGVKKTMLDNRLTLSLNVDDIFRSMNMDINTLGSDSSVQTSMQKQKFYQQKVKLGIVWNFGQAQKTRYRKVGNLDEASRMGGSGGGMGVSAGK